MPLMAWISTRFFGGIDPAKNDSIADRTGNVNWIHPEALIPSGNKQQITLRLDAEVLEFFKNTGARYQSRINAVLREYVRAHR